tara:strand:+ start:264 stop:1205 length:942 start_codon:yes stop_codon:yes gene_type:complete
MPRTLVSKIPWKLSAAETWRLRSDFEVETYVATKGGRKVTRVEERVENGGRCEERVHRVVDCEMLGENLGKTMRHVVKAEDLMSRVTASWYTHRHDEAHPAEFSVEVLKLKDKVKIVGQQWVEEQTMDTCILYTRVKIEVLVFGLGGLAESAIEKDMKIAHAAFPVFVQEYLDQERRAQDAEVLPPDPGLDKGLNTVVVPVPVPVPTPTGSVVKLAADFAPPLGHSTQRTSGRLTSIFGKGRLRGEGRRRRLYDKPEYRDGGEEGSDAIHVRCRTARFVLLCAGCARVVETAEEPAEVVSTRLNGHCETEIVE